MERDVDARRDVIRDERRHADAEVDVVAVLQLARDSPDDAIPAVVMDVTEQSVSRCAFRIGRPRRCASRKCPA